MRLTKYEQETIFSYNQEEKTAHCFTYDAALIRKLDKLAENDETIIVINKGKGWKEYNLPKRYIKVRPSRQLSDEVRKDMATRMKSIRKDNNNGMVRK